MIDAMSYETWKYMIPAYYEVALKEKFLVNPEDNAMVDLIRDTTIVLAPYLYGTHTGVSGVIDTLMKQRENNFATWYDQNKSVANEKLTELTALMRG